MAEVRFPQRFAGLPVYAFPRLRALLAPHAPGGPDLAMTIGEPQHGPPPFVAEVLAAHVHEFGQYPVNEGTPDLLAAIQGWLDRRYGARLAPENLMVLNGTREGLYNAAMALIPESAPAGRPVVLMPNPFYQVYMVAAISVGAEPVFVPATAATGHLPDYASLPPDILNRTAAAYICSPANPQGAVASAGYWQDLIALSERYGFRLCADECYSEIWRDAPPPGVLEQPADPEKVVAFHSLSKRSNMPGLRSGFVASGPRTIAALRQLRAYAGAPLPLPLQRVAARAWADETHVADSRALYQAKYRLADQALGDVPGYQAPPAGFFLWLPVADGEQAAVKLYRETGVRVLPGAYLAQDAGTGNPGHGYIRVALVANAQETGRGLNAIARSIYGKEG